MSFSKTHMFIQALKMDHITIGKNKADNWSIIGKASENDLWFHVDEMPSSHVILAAGAPKSLIKQCARLCKQHSKARDKRGDVSVVYTKIKNLALGRHVGEVLIKDVDQCKTILV